MNEKVIGDYVYHPKDQLGSGSYGQVFKARDQNNNQLVALKMIAKENINQCAYTRDALITEIKVMQRLQSDNIVKLLNIYQTVNNYYLVLEFCDGGDFSTFLRRKGKLPEADALKFLIQLFTAFVELIKNGIIHRDLKPENILIHKGTYKLADFGFAKFENKAKKNMFQSVVGTPLYMAPQILKAEKYSRSSDIWSIGMIYYQCLYGKTPWTGYTLETLFANIHKKKLEFDPKVPVSPESIDFITQCLQYDEAKRLNWDTIYQHKLLGNHFKDQQISKLTRQATTQFIINELRFTVASQKIDLMEFFKQFHFENENVITLSEFEKIITIARLDITKEEIEQLFTDLDEGKCRQINIEQLYRWFVANNVSITGSIEIQDKFINKQRVQIILDKIVQHLKKNGADHFQILESQITKNKNGLITKNEFKEFCLQIDSSMNQYDIDKVFSSLDQSNKNQLSLESLNQNLLRLINQLYISQSDHN